MAINGTINIKKSPVSCCSRKRDMPAVLQHRIGNL
nr:MAG TPA: hypothetical protein [Caudoviricetes sp.]